ncbi:MAG: polyprenyl synthetase family protein [Deltaproteobacteria bacterium]|nr:polyprenyl synthetase family protein [Deltaproteobacteria bacterium]
MISAAELDVLHRAIKDHPSAGGAGKHLESITALLSDILPQLEELIVRATVAPSPLDQATQQLIFAGGKRVRPVLTILFERLCGGDGKKCLKLAAATELIHSAALLHDDVIDEGDIRRGRPASRVLWGNLISVLSGDLLLTHALELIQQSGIPGAMEDILQTTRSMIHGEVLQLEARNSETISVETYFELVRSKTAALFAHSCRSGARAAGAQIEVIEACGRFGTHFGTAFQIIDDVLDLEGVPQEVGKQLGHDLSEGRITLPIALVFEGNGESIRPLVAKARSGDALSALLVSQLPLVRQACEKARAIALNESLEGKKAVAEILPNCRELQLLVEIAISLVNRRA